MSNQILIGSDHAGYDVKELVKDILNERSLEVSDQGCFDKNSVHYPEVAQKVAEPISLGKVSLGILICGTGIGMSIAANRYSGVRATLCHDKVTAQMSKEHNNSNLLVLGARVLEPDVVREIVTTWLDTEFDGGRHQIRLDMIG